MSESGCFWGRGQIYKIIFACALISGCELIATDGFYSIWVRIGTLDWSLTLYYSTFKEFNAAFSEQ